MLMCARPLLHRGHANLYVRPACACSLGDPWNELAEVAGDDFCKPGYIEQFSWMRMMFLSSEQGSSLPEVIVGCLVVPPLCNLLEQTIPVLSYSIQVPVLLAAAIINLRLVTLNFFTLQEHYKGLIAAAGFFQAGRGDFSRRQCVHAGFLIVGGQDGRLPQGTVSSEHFICVNSGASNHCYGNFLWIAKDIPYATVQGKPLCFLLEHVHVVDASPRIFGSFYHCSVLPYLGFGAAHPHCQSQTCGSSGCLR